MKISLNSQKAFANTYTTIARLHLLFIAILYRFPFGRFHFLFAHSLFYFADVIHIKLIQLTLSAAKLLRLFSSFLSFFFCN